jgi:hypothetical protein
MIRLLTLMLAVLFASTLDAQTPSDCTISQGLADAYEKDVAGMAIKRMQELNSPDLSLIDIPPSWKDSILEGMSGIYHAPGLAEADSVFNLYCVHDNSFNPAVLGFIIGVEPGSAMDEAWSVGEMSTGEPLLDSLLMAYGFSLQNYLGGIHAGVFYTDQYINLFALGDRLASGVDGVVYGEPDYLIGGAGRIDYSIDENGNQQFGFRMEWNDCFDGCDNYYTWFFEVTPDCEVSFLGIEEGGFFGIEPLPEPVNCMLSSAENTPPESKEWVIFPNPATHQLHLSSIPDQGNWVIWNAQGQQVCTGNATHWPLDIGSFSRGLYWLKWTGNNGAPLLSKAFIKQ